MRWVQGPQSCEDCGTILVMGPEPLDPDENADDAADWQTGARYQLVDWCPNIDCPSNHKLSGLRRVGANQYICTTCGQEIGGPARQYLGHRETH